MANAGETHGFLFKDEVFIIHKRPVTNHLGFVLLPVFEGQKHSKGCLNCGTCEPNVHHGLWPKPTNSPRKLKERASNPMFFNVPSYSKDPNKKLRNAPFSISDRICSGLHAAIHAFQLPPSELPDKDVIILGLDQDQRLRNAGQKAASLTLKAANARDLSTLGKDVDALEALYNDLPAEAGLVFPVHSISFVTVSELEVVKLPPLIKTYDAEAMISSVFTVISNLQKQLS